MYRPDYHAARAAGLDAARAAMVEHVERIERAAFRAFCGASLRSDTQGARA